jgi:hypothetical protein
MNWISPDREQLKPWVGRTVCAVLHDGSFYVGKVLEVHSDHVVLEEAMRGPYSITERDPEAARARVSGFLGSLFGTGAAGGQGAGGQGAGGAGGLFGGGLMSKLRLGFNVMSFLFPLIGKFFF